MTCLTVHKRIFGSLVRSDTLTLGLQASTAMFDELAMAAVVHPEFSEYGLGAPQMH